MKKLIYKIAKYFFQKYCEHLEKEIVFDDYQERCRIEKCKECGNIIYSEL